MVASSQDDGTSDRIATGIRKGSAGAVAILAGIDEAGFGPLLGPLVVSSCAFAVEPGLLEADLWECCRRSVGQARKGLAGRLLIADSKKAYKREAGLGHLERTVLAALHAIGREPADLSELLAVLGPDCLPRLQEYPWHQDLRRSRVAAGSADTRIAGRVFADDLQAHGARLLELRTCCLDVAFFNRMVHSVRNKAQVLFIAVTQLIQRVLDESADAAIRILVDRQGGRAHYREHLLRSFSGMDLTIRREDPSCSSYELRGGGRTVRLSFEVNGDERHLPVALASMVSKYVRELLMECMNEYFVGLDADLRPTAGYWKDGQRFVAELRQRLPNLKIDAEQLIRCR